MVEHVVWRHEVYFSENKMNWYVIQTVSGYEETVKKLYMLPMLWMKY